MKKILLAIAVLAVIYSCNSNSNKNDDANKEKDLAILSGKITNFKDKQILISYNSKTDTVEINENGEFTAKLLLTAPTHIIWQNGIQQARIYLFPKSKTDLTANFENFIETLKFKGDDAEVNNYLALQTERLMSAGINSEEFLYASKYETFKASLDKLIELHKLNLSNFASKNGTKYSEFIDLEEQRFLIISGTIQLSYFTALLNSNKPYTELESEIKTVISKMKLDDPKLIQLYEYKPFVQNFIAYKLSEKLKATNKELTSTTEYADMYFGLIDENFANPIVIEELYYSFLKDFINYYGAESIGSIYKKYKSLSSNKERLAEFEKIFGDLDKLSPGNPSVDFSFPDVSGKVYSLSDFKGKYLYIDVWASWCGPCKQEIPYLRALKEKFKSKNIQIIGISVDETKSDWESILKSENLTGIQLYAGGWDNDLCNFFKINGIPRFILIDKQGNIINSNAERPSGDIEKILNGLEGM